MTAVSEQVMKSSPVMPRSVNGCTDEALPVARSMTSLGPNANTRSRTCWEAVGTANEGGATNTIPSSDAHMANVPGNPRRDLLFCKVGSPIGVAGAPAESPMGPLECDMRLYAK